jgi:ABC-type amino acid transport substrate-binding protein
MIRFVSRMLGVVALVACAVSVSAADLAAIRQRGALRVLGVPDDKEGDFLAMKAGTPIGFDVEILLAFARSEGVRLELVPLTEWAALGPALAADKGDVIGGRYTASPARAHRYAFTDEVFPTRTVVVTRKPHPPVKAVDQLAKERVGTIRGTSLAEAALAAGIPAARLDDSIVSGGLSDALRGGKITAAVWAVEGAIISQRRDPELEMGAFLGPAQSLAYAVRFEDKALLAALNEHIRSLRRTGAWHRLVEKHFGAASLDVIRKVKEE